MRKRFVVVVCLLPLLLVTAAASAESTDGEGVASAGGTAAPNATRSLSRLDLLTRFAQCMREHGVPMTHPEVDGDIVRQGRYDKNAVSADTEVEAEEACKRLRPPQETGLEADLKNELSRQFARCMREHGVENYPDPNPGGTRIGEDIGKDPQFDDAKALCTAQRDAAQASMRPSAGATR
ncbi:hypothetical protein [Nonomuraea sp. KM90]|uniref:hypothetical protein n=1 Tax=Nonomuraea sp. KM90 TaxID=3457428 RepID=UPI003FCD35E1